MTPTSKSEDTPEDLPEGHHYDAEESAVGYGSPPKHSQYKKGQSGNPKGRPPSKVLHTVLKEVLNEVVTVVVDGQKVDMTKKEAIIQRLLNESMKGKSEATKTLFYLLKNLYYMEPM